MHHAELPRLDGARVLVVEGHGDTLELNRTALVLLGAEVRAAESGEAALEVLRGWWPNALLTELRLPGMSAFELADQAAAVDPRPLPVIATSADARPRARQAALGRGFRDCLVKPYDPVALCVAVADALGRARQEAS